jgi:hypothetical protein
VPGQQRKNRGENFPPAKFLGTRFSTSTSDISILDPV